MRSYRFGQLATIIALMVAVTTWTGGVGRPVEAADSKIGATLYGSIDVGITPGGFTPTVRHAPTSGLQVYSDIPDLRDWNFNDKAIALTVSVPTAVAAYSDINYGGTCETFFGGRLYDLTGTMIGPNSISSIKLNSTCLGPTPGKPIVTDLTLVSSAYNAAIPPCPNTYTRLKQDLNQSVNEDPPLERIFAHGDRIHVCVQYGPSNSKEGIQNVSVIGPFEPGPTCCDGSFHTADQACKSPSHWINTDVNKNVPGFKYGYLCVTPFVLGITPFSSNSPSALRDVFVYSQPTGQGIYEANCAAYLDAPVESIHTDLGNLNMHDITINFAYLLDIYLCTSTWSGPGAATPMGDTTPPTITGTALLMPVGCGIFCIPTPVAAGSTVTTAGTVTVSWACADDSGRATASPPANIVRNSSWNLTGTCTDPWGNQATKTFSFVRRVP